MSNARRSLMKFPWRASIAAAIFLGITLALSWADWFMPEFYVVVASGLLAILAPGYFLFRPPVGLKESILGKIGTWGMVSVCLWLSFAQTVPALVTAGFGEPRLERARVVSYGWSYGKGFCKYRLAVDGLLPFGGGFCGAGEDASSFIPGEVIDISMQCSVLGCHVLGFAKPKANSSFDRTATGSRST
jgi:hypothetical protein